MARECVTGHCAPHSTYCEEILGRDVFINTSRCSRGTLLQRVQRLVESTYPPCCFTWFWEERDVHGSQALFEGTAGEAAFWIGVERIWRSIVSRPAVAQRHSDHLSSDVPEALLDRALEVDVHIRCAAPLVYEYCSEYS